MFDLRSIRLATGEQHRDTLPVAVDPFTVGGEEYTPDPARPDADFRVTRLRNGWVFEETFDVDVHGPCHRCLGPATVELGIDAREFHAFKPEPGAEEEMTSPYLVDDVIDTDRMASDAVVLAMPVQVLCRVDCAGLCPRCGADLNDGPCGCPPDEPDSRFEKLRELL